jgi:hypothetical protein
MKKQLFKFTFYIAVLIAMPVLAGQPADGSRLEAVGARGAKVMPFDLAQTTHVFSKTSTGGIQQVLVKESGNSPQIVLIRQHLFEISSQFKQGDFSNPAKIHGEDMPGLAQLRSAKPGEIKIVYRELPAGAEIDYSSDTPNLVEAIHRWFDAQLSDHARHAITGHEQHQMQPMQ